MLETKGHKESQPGLRGHSHDPEQDLMKRYVVREALQRSNGYIWVASFSDLAKGIMWTLDEDPEGRRDFDIIDQFNGNVVVFEDYRLKEEN